MYVNCWMNNYRNIYKTKVLTSFASFSLRVKHITSSQALKLPMFIVLVFYNNLEMHSYLHNRYIVSQQRIDNKCFHRIGECASYRYFFVASSASTIGNQQWRLSWHGESGDHHHHLGPQPRLFFHVLHRQLQGQEWHNVLWICDY